MSPPPPRPAGTSRAAAPAKGGSGSGSWFWFLTYLTLTAGLAACAYKAYQHFVVQKNKCPTIDPRKLRWPPEGKSLWCRLFCCCKK